MKKVNSFSGIFYYLLQFLSKIGSYLSSHQEVLLLRKLIKRDSICSKKTVLNTGNNPQEWLTVSTSVIGTSHTESGIPCQDASTVRVHGNSVIGVSADGAGSAAHSDKGATLAVQKTLELCQVFVCELDKQDSAPSQKQVEEFSKYLIHQLRIDLQKCAEELNQPFKALACTLNLFIASTKWLIVVQVGDGFTVVYPADKQEEGFYLVFKPNRGEFCNEVAAFLTSSNVFQEIQATVLHGYFPFICQATDGMENSAIEFKGWKPFPRFFIPLWKQMLLFEPKIFTLALSQLLNSEQINSQTFDDKSIVMAIHKAYNTDSLVDRGFTNSLSQPNQNIPINKSKSKATESYSNGDKDIKNNPNLTNLLLASSVIGVVLVLGFLVTSQKSPKSFPISPIEQKETN